MFAIDKRRKFLRTYMNGLIQINDAVQLQKLLNCALFSNFIDLISK